MTTADEALVSVQEDDFEPYTVTLAEFVATCPEFVEHNARAAALAVGESFQIDEGPLAHAPTWTITRTR